MWAKGNISEDKLYFSEVLTNSVGFYYHTGIITIKNVESECIRITLQLLYGLTVTFNYGSSLKIQTKKFRKCKWFSGVELGVKKDLCHMCQHTKMAY